jgi:N-acylglucosamine-6-phosphate 2-epimerase
MLQFANALTTLMDWQKQGHCFVSFRSTRIQWSRYDVGPVMMAYTLVQLDEIITGKLVVSCQPVENGPLDHDETVVRLAQAALSGGAAAVRLEGAQRVGLAKSRFNAPVIGIVKYDLAEYPVRITPYERDVDALAAAGADIIAFDATSRNRPCSVQSLVNRVHAMSRVAMADCATLAEAIHALECGCDIIGTTLAGYTGGEIPAHPDFDLLQSFIELPARIMAEGRYADPASVMRAKAIGAWAVTVGTAITRIEIIVSEYARILAETDTAAMPAFAAGGAGLVGGDLSQIQT